MEGDDPGASPGAARVKAEPGTALTDYVVKEEARHIEEALKEPKCESNAACVSKTEWGLYTNHEVKDELVVGPEQIQFHKVAQHGVSRPLVSDYESYLARGPGAPHAQQPPGHSLRHDATDTNSDHTKKKYPCGICNKQYRKNYLKIHERFHTGEKPYTCEVCKKGFAVLCLLKAHNRIHTEERPHSCDICKKSFARTTYLKLHMRSHSGEKPYLCGVCKKGFAQIVNLKSHIRTHTGEKPFGCTMCDKRFVQSSNLERHKRVHSREKPYVCEICKENFAEMADLKTHKLVHDEQNFARAALYADHVVKDELVLSPEYVQQPGVANIIYGIPHRKIETPKLVHDERKVEFARAALYADHEIKDEQGFSSEYMKRPGVDYTINGEPPREVEASGPGRQNTSTDTGRLSEETTGGSHQPAITDRLTFNMASQLSSHVNLSNFSIHSDFDEYNYIYRGFGATHPNSYACATCGHTFPHKHYLLDHEKMHLQEISNESNLIHEPSGNNEKGACKICNKMYRISYLKIHERSHTGEKHACEVCKKKFSLMKNLRKHEKIHTKPYTCDICKKGFARPNSLKLHQLKHSGRKPFKCDICKKSFTLLVSLNRHIRLHTGDKLYSCTICNKHFNQLSGLNYHIRTHTDRPFSCEICKETFRKANWLQKHKHEHAVAGRKPECESTHPRGASETEIAHEKEEHKSESSTDSCGVSSTGDRVRLLLGPGDRDRQPLDAASGRRAVSATNSEPASTDHDPILADTTDPAQPDMTDPVPPDTTDPVPPDTTATPQATPNQDAKNIKDNPKTSKQITSKRPYSCDICKKAFTQSGSLNTHKRIHTGEKPYTCEICNKKFTALATLRHHKIVHTKERPYSCKVCDKKFRRLCELTIHERNYVENSSH